MEMIKGTSGKPDYFILGRKHNMVMGVKPEVGFIEKNGGTFMMGMRIRGTIDPSWKGNNPPHDIGGHIVDIMPSLPWHTVKATHASTSVAVVAPPIPLSLHEKVQLIKESKAVEVLLDRIGKDAGIDYTSAHLSSCVEYYHKQMDDFADKWEYSDPETVDQFKEMLKTMFTDQSAELNLKQPPKLQVLDGGKKSDDSDDPTEE